LKKINKTMSFNELTKFTKQNPHANWNIDFRNYNNGNDYRIIRKHIVKDQGGLCAYCETKIKNLPCHKQRIEHFHSKSDILNPNKNWAFDWNNLIGVCVGGEDSNKQSYSLPENLSCDSHKNHLVNKKELSMACENVLLNPLNIVASPCLFDFNKATGELMPADDVCSKIEIKGNEFQTTQMLVINTIKILNLNCDRLVKQRLLVRNEYNKKITIARKNNDKNCFLKIAKQWFQNRWLCFFTTRRILLGKYAEDYLKQIKYDG